MKIREAVAILAFCVTAFALAYLFSEGRRYDVVAVGAGSGGSQDRDGSTDLKAYLVDHKTGMTGFFSEEKGTYYETPYMRLSCKQAYGRGVPETKSGCSPENTGAR